MINKDLVKLFTEAAEISSPSGYEKDIAGWITNKMNDLGWKVWTDDSGKKNQSNSGNIYAYLEVSPEYKTLVFSAHMDTVQKLGEQVKVKFDGKVFTSTGKTILGADNKAGIVSLLALAESLDIGKLSCNLLFFFTTHEEAGVMGSSFFKFDKASIKYVFNLDSSDLPGVFVYKSLGYENFIIEVHGLASHAAKSYDKGKDAVKISASLINSLPIGKNSQQGWTLNIGQVHGGEATNVVCDLVTLTGEIRAFKDQTIKSVEEKISQISQKIGKRFNTQIKFKIKKSSYIPPFNGDKNSAIAKLCYQTSLSVGLKPIFKESFSTSDANNLSGKGYPTISVSRGGSNAHSNSEKLQLRHLKQTAGFLKKLVETAMHIIV
ncbi:hypothetical protein A2631_01055 [Candidatus Daviesbacteria bacterium RIFCSPHIGHO2_01_FULL_44_29]|uniref:Peptidase M20 dimerisation domain-containing protein n=1 Tax=Candidatus Daviesbacteria bacterium RIFCSPHIGHO2_02_FULL_43_12 TaxID=1797776 RepID=A0A1F5KIH6_9BACT|nr:MAG: hypothetical protein A2631_01055 [Candidatus Daviesbacteria bacterium RIFCSPHIGHO2_01_FULL_44_29]OGE40426.1 MAG: hypothetical protein A3E86_03230 [Candidatus Daviesbacteria bacterium RIFCSPHIGHO2_12_FULL_47_45]OGE40736.1 MAG: hypothetical protein A3D25_05690 [Candidatus Daviesbacteria bacterium RIFCSPHIGHO2_02_FULL_43_12]OGE69767.1 MAG: hypothetical protein A3B55_05120 [Candidatus Daviesbacteria bacterium RIFCSPLOWO2_01_FULL_43_15]